MHFLLRIATSPSQLHFVARDCDASNTAQALCFSQPHENSCVSTEHISHKRDVTKRRQIRKVCGCINLASTAYMHKHTGLWIIMFFQVNLQYRVPRFLSSTPLRWVATGVALSCDECMFYLLDRISNKNMIDRAPASEEFAARAATVDEL